MDLKEILSRLNIEALNEMQKATIEAFKKKNDLVLLSPTGSGKTLAVLLPLLDALDKEKSEAAAGKVKAVILTPSRELALQIENVFKSLKTPFTAISCYGGRPAMEEHRVMNAVHPDVIIGTPGRMNDHLTKENFSTEEVKTLIIDEFDKSLELGFHDEMQEVISQLPELRKRVLLSATDIDAIPEFVGVAQDRAGRTLPFIKLDYSQVRTTEGRLSLRIVHSPEKDKLETLYRLLLQLGAKPGIVFVNYRESVERVYNYLKEHKIPCEAFHGGMEQQDRERALYKFSNGTSPILVSTDLAARGLDIEGIEHVIHYHIPVNEETFTHRNGRTARWDASGNAFLILNDAETKPEYIPEDAEEFELSDTPLKPFKSKWATLYIGKGKKDKLSKIDIVGFMHKKGSLAREELGRVDVRDHYSFVAVRRSKVKQLLTLVRGEKIKGMKTIIEEAK